MKQKDELAILAELFTEWWFCHHDDSQFFNAAVKECPEFAAMVDDLIHEDSQC